MAIFPLTNKSKYKHADYLYTYHWKTTTNELNAGHIRSFVWLPNVSSQLYTFFCLYRLENCTRLKNCRLVLCSIFKTVFPFTLSRKSTDRHVAHARPQSCSISCSSPLNLCWVQRWVLHSRLMTHITKRRMRFNRMHTIGVIYLKFSEIMLKRARNYWFDLQVAPFYCRYSIERRRDRM